MREMYRTIELSENEEDNAVDAAGYTGLFH